MEGATCSLAPPRHRQVERTLAEFANYKHISFSCQIHKFFSSKNGGAGITLRQCVLLPSFQEIKKRWIWSLCLLMPKTEGMLYAVMIFFSLQNLEHVLNLLKHRRCRLIDLIVGFLMTMPDPGWRIWMGIPLSQNLFQAQRWMRHAGLVAWEALGPLHSLCLIKVLVPCHALSCVATDRTW